MPRVTFNRLSTRRARTKRRRSSTAVKAKYMPKTTRANRSLIKSNAAAIRTIRRMIPPAVYCDFQYTSAYSPFLDNAPGNYFNIFASDMMSPRDQQQPPQILWQPVLRQDPNVLNASKTLVKRFKLNLRFSLGESNWCQISTFLVTLRKDAANRVVSQNGLILDEDYVYSDQNFNPTLNSQVFKCHFVRHVSLMSNAWQQPKTTIGTGTEFVGNPNTTLKKSQVNVKCNISLRQPIGTPWVQMSQDQLPPHQRYYLLTFFKGNTNGVDDDPPRVDWDALYTTYNAA